ncbi:hypothetical protein BDW22DRAFT_652496 [Trametopsis cervina]|nr:hypothetical protein BDW22DRAFT_652496 [Trametopsis cervina]
MRGCGIDDKALKACARFIDGKQTIRELHLQNNTFGADPAAVTAFAHAINASHLATLKLSSNPHGPTLVPALLSTLSSAHLHTLELSTLSLTAPSAVPLAAFLTSPHCHLRTLTLNGNALGTRGARALHAALRLNYSLTQFEMFAGGGEGDEDDEEQASHALSLADALAERRAILTRNQILQQQVTSDALTLLRHARAALLPFSPSSLSSMGATVALRLPTELVLHVLSFLAPSLSPAQCLRVCTYAADRTTLPPLLPRLSSHRCVPDPSAFPPPAITVANTKGRAGRKNGVGSGGGCSDECCMGAAHHLSCRRATERAEWLRDMQCETLDPGGWMAAAFASLAATR